jgi:hypothetical protein
MGPHMVLKLSFNCKFKLMMEQSMYQMLTTCSYFLLPLFYYYFSQKTILQTLKVNDLTSHLGMLLDAT